MEKFKEIRETSFGWSADDKTTRLLFPGVTASIRAHATRRDTALRGTSKCRACGITIGKGMSRYVFRWLTEQGWSESSFIHVSAEDCKKVDIWDAHQTADYHAGVVLKNDRR